MSVQYHKEIYCKGNIKLLMNFIGFSPDNCIERNDFSLVLYAINTKTLEQIFSVTLNYEESQVLFNQLNSVSILRDNTCTRTGEFFEITDDLSGILSAIKNIDSSVIKSIFDNVNDDEKLKLIFEALSECEIQNLQASIQQSNYQKSLANLQLMLELEEKTNITESIKEYNNLSEYLAGQPEKIFQNWIETNTWTLGNEYIKKHPSRKIGINSESDVILETTDGFIDLIELKRPKFDLFMFDNSHKCYYPSNELSKVIGQCIEYLKILDNYKLILEKENKFKLLRPRIKIIAGRTNNFDEKQFETLRMLNSVLNHVQIISYDYLLLCGENIISYYKKSS